MTNKEAIRILGLECDDWETSHCTPSERREAFDMAISALQAQDIDACRVPEVAKDTNVLNNDTISRQAAINVTWEEPTYTDPLNVLTEVRDRIKALPSVQPDLGKYEYHYDHTDCIWYRPEARNRCPVTCAQYRDGWNDAMNYIFRDGKGYRPYRRDKQYEE